MMDGLPFPSDTLVEEAAAAVLRTLRAHPHLYSHSLRYLPEKAQKEIAKRIAWSALFSAWVMPGHRPVEDFALRIRELAQALIDAGDWGDPPRPMIKGRVAEKRYCLHCDSPRYATYIDMALRCSVCNRPTVALEAANPAAAPTR